jgi:pimeloyl-ACP methyl ester carboxylesterase
MSGKNFVLVHGAFAGEYAWSLIRPILESAGNTVLTLDLPAHGDDTTPVTAATFEAYQEAVLRRIESASTPVILVGHSMAGIVISQVAERIPEQIEKLVYLSAYLPKDGQSLQELAMQDAESLIGPNLQFAPDYSGATLPEAIAIQVFAGDCSDEIKKLVAEKSKLEPLAAFQAKVSLTDANFGRVPKYYIETLKDQGVGNTLQKRMVVENGTVIATYSIDSGHSPYFAKPTELAEILAGL